MWPFLLLLLLLFFNPTTVQFTFRLRGWCMLGVFLLPPFTRIRHECQDLWVHACVHRLDLVLYTHPKEFLRNGVRTHVNSKEKIPSTGDSEKGRIHDAASHRTAIRANKFIKYLQLLTFSANVMNTHKYMAYSRYLNIDLNMIFGFNAS